MSELTQAQVRKLLKRAADLVEQSHKIRDELEAIVMRVTAWSVESEQRAHDAARNTPRRKSTD